MPGEIISERRATSNRNGGRHPPESAAQESGGLNAAMVRRGWAVDFTRYSAGRYQPEEQQARREGLGMWAGRFEMPWEWRHRH